MVSPLVHKNALDGFPFPAGTTWVYRRDQYSQVGPGATNILTATNLITETVTQTEVITPAIAMHYKRTAGLVTASPGWVDNSSDFEGESWSLIIGNRVFSSPEEPRSPDPPEVDVKGAHLHAVTYDLPLVEGRSWCPFDPPPSYNPQCLSMGRLTVPKRESYTTPVAIFEECYEITEEYNSGGVTEWFCNGLGVVARKYDHSGTRFGFEDTLISYSRGPMEK